MNNALFTDEDRSHDAPNVIELQNQQGQIEQTLAAVRGIRGNQQYNEFAKWVLEPQLEAAKRRLLREKNQDERTALQAMILTLEKYSDLDSLAAFYSNELRGIQLRIIEANKQKDSST